MMYRLKHTAHVTITVNKVDNTIINAISYLEPKERCMRRLGIQGSSGPTGDSGEVGRGGHGDRRRGDVFGFNAIPNQLVEVRRVHVLVVVPPEAVEGDQ